MNGKIDSPQFSSLRLDGGKLCLDFTNTVYDRTVTPPKDYLGSFLDLVDWLRFTKTMSKQELDTLKKKAVEHPVRAKKAFTDAIRLRELLFRIFAVLADQGELLSQDLASLNRELISMLQYTRLAYSNKRFTAGWDTNDDTLATVLWPIGRSALELLLANDVDRLKKCPMCHWLFYDTSKNGRRRWCSMETCGSIDKSLRYYYRQKSAPAKGSTRA